MGKYLARLFISLIALFTVFFITLPCFSSDFLCCSELNALCTIYDLYRDYISVISAAATSGLLQEFLNNLLRCTFFVFFCVSKKGDRARGIVMDEIEIAHTPCVSLSVVLTQSMRFCLMLNFLRCERTLPTDPPCQHRDIRAPSIDFYLFHQLPMPI